MDTKLACLIQGVIGVFFGLLALLLPDITLTTFLAFFWLLLIGGVLVLLFLAITAKSEESIFFFMISAALVFVGVGSFFFHGIVAIIFLLIIAGYAFYTGFAGIRLALAQPKTKYLLIAGMFAIDLLLIAGIIRYIPMLTQNPVMMVLGVTSFVFGIFLILMGWHLKEGFLPAQQ
ncbi:MAG: hypothetical protein NTY71_01845 [Methanoregula sp.]|jgi:uncharacterized membrane protein HdeD (DUF308 family)|nr:hypothetical protein [Methanoregula sp.]